MANKQGVSIGSVFRKLLTHAKNMVPRIVAVVLLASASAFLTIIGPSYVSQITQCITDGLTTSIDLAAIGRVGCFLMGMYLLAAVFGFFENRMASTVTLRVSNHLRMTTSIDLAAIGRVGCFLMGMYLLAAVFGFFENRMASTVTLRVSNHLRNEISEKINRVPMPLFHRMPSGDILSRMTNDVQMLTQTLTNSLPTIVAASAQFVGCLVMMFSTEWRMSLVAIGATVLGFALMGLITASSQKYFVAQQTALGNLNGYVEEMYSGHSVIRVSRAGSTIALMGLITASSQKYFVAQQTALGNLNGYVEEMYSGHSVIRVSRAGSTIRQEFQHYNDAVYEANRKAQFLSGIMQPLMGFVGNLGYVAVCIYGALLAQEFQHYNDAVYEANRKAQFLSGIMQPLMGFVGNLGYVAVCIYGALLAMQGRIGFGVIVAFIMYVRLFTSPLSEIAQGVTQLQTAAASGKRIFSFLEEEELEPEPDKRTALEPVRGQVEFSHVRFAYPSDPDKTIIQDFSASIAPGQKVAIVGPTGAGKSTLVNLLMRFFETNGGEIKIDGIPIRDMTRGCVHDLFAMVLQDTWLFQGTLRENLVYNKKDVPDEVLERACRACGIWDFVQSLPQGFDTQLSEHLSISAGQKQLLTIARAMIQNRPMLILDEATSSVDTRTELVTQQAMDQLCQDRTSFVIAHRLSTIKNADLILVLKDGNVIEQGSHQQLLDQGGFYASIYNSQFEHRGGMEDG